MDRALDVTELQGSDDGDRHIAAVAAELEWLSTVIEARVRDFAASYPFGTLPPPPAVDPLSRIGEVIAGANLEEDGRVMLALALAPHLQPSLLDPFFVRNTVLDRPFTEFGGQIRAHGSAFLPTGETALFLIGGTDLAARTRAARLLDPQHMLRQMGIVSLDAPREGGPPIGGVLNVPREQVAYLATGQMSKPDYASDFPARRLTTDLSWDDLVLPPDVIDQIEHISGWLQHEHRILHDWGLKRSLAPGYRALFYGPPGTGKTLTAALLGQRAGLDVYRIDLSMVVSKYIGETEKNLAGVFDQAAHKNWILFFDEADALFGARSSGTSSNDRYANQEVAYLLQRIETCPSLVILATNLRGNIDDAFSRRFQSLVGFTKPDAAQRLRLWQGVVAGGLPVAGDVDLPTLAKNHELVGGAIVNVVRHASISALRRGRDDVSQADLIGGISSEMRKEGRTP